MIMWVITALELFEGCEVTATFQNTIRRKAFPQNVLSKDVLLLPIWMPKTPKRNHKCIDLSPVTGLFLSEMCADPEITLGTLRAGQEHTLGGIYHRTYTLILCCLD